MNIKTVGIIGDSAEKPELNSIAEKMGILIAKAGYTLITGGRDGVMGAASRGARSVDPRPETARVIGIMPGTDEKGSNPYLDYIIPTGVGWARNQIVVLSSDIIVAIGGGAGTLSEISYSWVYNKPILAFTGVEGWSNNLAGKVIDYKRTDPLIKVTTPEEAIKKIKEIFSDQ
ncbi:MAG: TIGR00725 family protein [Proteobacteria bacterium]|nr:TIGR00725 family protein [Pseudomonadota bacterium]